MLHLAPSLVRRVIFDMFALGLLHISVATERASEVFRVICSEETRNLNSHKGINRAALSSKNYQFQSVLSPRAELDRFRFSLFV